VASVRWRLLAEFRWHFHKSPDTFISRKGLPRPTATVVPFDEQAQGTVVGHGVGVVVLKRLTDALSDGDHIWAIIKSLCN